MILVVVSLIIKYLKVIILRVVNFKIHLTEQGNRNTLQNTEREPESDGGILKELWMIRYTIGIPYTHHMIHAFLIYRGSEGASVNIYIKD